VARAIYGITNNNIYSVSSTIKNYKRSLPDKDAETFMLQLLDYNHAVNTQAKVVLIPSVKQAIRNREPIHRADGVIFVFDSPVQCGQLVNIELLDVVDKPTNWQYTFRPLPEELVLDKLLIGLASDPNLPLITRDLAIIPSILGGMQDDLSTRIMGFLYKIPNINNRKEVQGIVYDWLLSSSRIDDLFEALKITVVYKSKRKPSPEIAQLYDYLISECGRNYINALRLVDTRHKEKRPVNYAKIGQSYDVAPDDIKSCWHNIKRAKEQR